MKKLGMVVCHAAVLLLLSLCTVWGYAEQEPAPENVFILPPALRTIGESAFEGTAAEKVFLGDDVESIGERAFARIPGLSDVFIPPSVGSIGRDAFVGSAELTVHGAAGSYAQEWAQKHKVRFVVDDIWHEREGRGHAPHHREDPAGRYSTVDPFKEIKPSSRTVDEGRAQRPQERPELPPIDYRFP